jgi:hypothetical protein
MAPSDALFARDYPCGYGQYLYNGRCQSYGAWYWWGRWLFAGIVILFVIFCLVCLGCINARRRRKRGLTPMYGTGWMANGKNGGGNPPQGYNNEMYPQNGYQGPPAYGQTPQYTGTTFNPNDGYYGNQQGGPQYPQNAYQPPENVYSPSPGPPPAKH